MKILIVDDHAVIHQGLRRILGDEFTAAVFGEARSYQQSIDMLPQHRWDVVILDVDLSGRGGLDLLREIKARYSRLPVLMFSMHSEDQFAVRALRAGASGYVAKDSPSEQLLQAVRKVARGGKYVSASLAEKLAFDLAHQAPLDLHEILSNREFEVMRLIAAGNTTAAIGSNLSLSVKTVSTYRSRVLEKLGLQSNAELIRYAIDRGLDRG
jgi:two-component system invasion response regulator UvrY